VELKALPGFLWVAGLPVVCVQPNHDLRSVSSTPNVPCSYPFSAERGKSLMVILWQVPLLFSVLCGNICIRCLLTSHTDEVVKIGKTSAVMGPFVSGAIISASGNNDNMPFTFLFGLGTFSTVFLFMLDVEKSRIECEEFVAAEVRHDVFGTGSK